VTEQRTHSQSRIWIEALLDLLPTPVMLVDPETVDVTWANRAADRLAGGRFPRGQERFGDGDGSFGVRCPETGGPLPREESPSYRAADSGHRVDGVHLDFVTPEGVRSLVASADLLPPIGDMPPTVIASFEDVTELRRAQRTSEDAKALLDTLFESAPIGLAYLDSELRFVRVNDALAEINGITADDHIGRSLPELRPDAAPAVIDGLRHVVESGEPLEDVEVRGHTAAEPEVERTWLQTFYPVRGGDGEILGTGAVVVDITERKAAEAGRERALAAEREARSIAEAAAARSRFLAEASVLLDRTLDFDETLANLARLAVPDVGDWCTVDLIESGELRNVVVSHADPAKVEFGTRMLSLYHYPPDAPNGPPEVFRTGRSELLPEITDEMLAANARNEEHLEMLRELGMRSVMVVPMISRGRMLGTLTFVSSSADRLFDEDDVLLAEDLARRAGVAIDNARLYSERARIARTLQDSLLPPQLPTIPGVEVAARYVAAGEGIDVGGDFYDVFDLGGGWSVVMGDVCGKGPDAAALTALARYTLRATADQVSLPSEALASLNDAVLRQRGDGRFITVVYARLAANGVAGTQVTLSTGGHPQPILLRADGTATPVGEPGTLLGVVGDPDLSDAIVDLAPGDALFLYTDGVTEAHAPDRILEAEDVARLLEDCAGGDAADLVRCVEEAVAALGTGPPGDDIAMLVLRVPPTAGGA
jgi:PAS domain S-box-containing protein